ncbi:hypothetical protein AVEN_150214-1 [Araneus ventricosus]|uniref:Uncharacterized protein n=1 Tax=Araneus ventricosus TaxID=182803 RepID=A0A4Y2QHW8_ARAVE|nr:hypothetical protein AVEN_150214-1 [Araneus ventricosus]
MVTKFVGKVTKFVAKSPKWSPSRQNGRQARRQRQGSRNGRCPLLHTYPCKTPSPTIRLAGRNATILLCNNIITMLRVLSFVDSEEKKREEYAFLPCRKFDADLQCW